MTERERISVFINSLEPDGDPFLRRIEQESIADGIPVIRHEMISFLRVLIGMNEPRHILEIGTATGFSALVMAAASGPDCRITTIERDRDRLEKAARNIGESPWDNKITILEGEAQELLRELPASDFDFIFMDGAKGQYIHFLADVKCLLAPGGILLSDNVLQEGDLLESHYLVERRNRTIYKRMREYLYALKHDPDLITSVIPIGDGAALSLYRPQG